MEVEIADDLVSHMVSNVDGDNARLPMQKLIQYALSISDAVMWVAAVLPGDIQGHGNSKQAR